jgi:hypothetical protein
MSVLLDATESIRATPRHPLIGAEVRGIDLAQPLDRDVFERV